MSQVDRVAEKKIQEQELAIKVLQQLLEQRNREIRDLERRLQAPLYVPMAFS